MPSYLLAKVPALIVVLLAEKWAFICPFNSTPTAAERAKYGREDISTLNAIWGPRAMMVFNSIIVVCEIAVILAQEYPSPISSTILHTLLKHPSSTVVDRLSITSSFIAGFALLITGALIRQLCFATLGKQFTYQLAVLKDHELITSGPYALVRHPSYTGALLAINGMLLVELFPGTYLAESGALDSWWARLAAWAWAMSLVRTQIDVVIGRTFKEDRVLREHFGRRWDEWAERVPYKLIPYVY